MASPQLCLPILAAEELQLSDAETIFNLVQTHDMDWVEFRTSFDMPDDCARVLDMIDASVSSSDGKHEMALRLRLGILLVAVHSTSPDRRTPDLDPIPLSPGSRFSFEPVLYQEEVYCLQGTPAYSLWYGQDSWRDNTAVKSVVVETERGESLSGIPQALAYMGMAHRQRQYEKRDPIDLFGLSTDHEQFHFLRISCEGQWSRLDVSYLHRQQIIETLAYIHRQAYLLSILPESAGSRESCPHAQMYPCLMAVGNDGKSASDKPWSRFLVEEHWTIRSDRADGESDIEYDS